MGSVRRARDWCFCDRQTGQITIGQTPNAPLWVFLVASAARALLDPSGGVGTALAIVATAALVVWASDELVRGVNPWRRFLGAVVLLWQATRLVG